MNQKKFLSTSMSKLSSVSNVKSNYVEIVMDYSQFANLGINSYKDLFYEKLGKGVVYSYLTKVSKDEDIYLSLHETQKSFKLGTDHDIERLEALEIMINSRLDQMYDNYNDILQGEVDFIILQFMCINPVLGNLDEYTIPNIDKVKEVVSRNTVNKLSKEFMFFDSVEGEHLKLMYNHKGVCYFDNPLLEEFIFDNMDYKDSVFKLLKNKGKYYVICSSELDDKTKFKQALNIYGDSLYKIYEYKDESGNLVHKSGNFITSFNSNKEVIDITKNIKFNSIYRSIRTKSNRYTVNDNIGTIDLETYKDDHGISHCYAIGFYTQDLGVVTRYINKDRDSSLLVHELFDEMFKNNDLSVYKFYCHNLGGFDAPFIIKSLLRFNETLDIGKYKFDIFARDNSIVRLTIKRRIKKMKNKSYIYVNRSVSIYDSLAILPMSLRELCKVYKVDTSKSFFPYPFVKPNTLHYIGIIPDKEYYKVDSRHSEEFNLFYEENYSQNWNLQEETLKYLNLDLVSLYKVLKTVNINMFTMFGVHMTDNSTVSGIALNIFFKNFYDREDNKKIPLINSTQIYKDIYNAYYGGRVEVFIPTPINNEKLYYYDVNSLYPFSSLKDIPGLNWTYKKFILEPNIDDLFGFFYCKITTDKNAYLGLLPYRSEEGGLKYPLGEWYGWYFSEELKLAKKNGYKIKVIKGYNTDKATNVFNGFVNKIYEHKLYPKNISEKNIAKLLLNSLIGRFGMNPNKSITRILTDKEHSKISITRRLKNSIYLDDYNYLDTFYPEISPKVCKEFDIDYEKVINNTAFNFKRGRSITNTTVSISTAAAILSYSRIYMMEVMLQILQKGGRIYYTDTDSIVTNIKLDNSLVDPNGLGKFKLEHEIVKSYFLSDKTYLIINSKGETIKKAKGVNQSSLSLQDYVRLYNMEIFQGPVKSMTKRDYQLGTVDIYDKAVTLNIDKYNKRERVFINNKWVNTKPILVKEI